MKTINLLVVAASTLVTSLVMAQNSASTTTSAAAPQTVAPQGTSTTQAAQEQKSPLGNFGASFVFDIVTAPDAVNNLGSSNNGNDEQSIESTNFGAISYKLTKDTKVGVRQYWTQNLGPSAAKPNGEASWLAVTMNTKTAGILGSDELAPMVWYYVPTSYNKVLENGNGGTLDHYGIARLDLEIPWTLNPKWSVSYYFNPRQSFLQDGTRKYTLKNAKVSTDDSSSMMATTTLIHYGYLYYTFNDKLQSYAAIGARHRFATNDAFRNYENVGLPAAGLNYTVNKYISLNAEVNEGVSLTSGKYDYNNNAVIEHTAAPVWLDSHDFKYEFVISLSI